MLRIRPFLLAIPVVLAGANMTLAQTELGIGADASGIGSTALGLAASASGEFSTALGSFARVEGADSTALGFDAEATAINSIAIGAKSSANRENQIALGSVTQTLTIAGVTSQASAMAQTGPLQLLTTDASGNVAADGGATLTAIGSNTTAIGNNTTAIGNNTTAIGSNTTAIDANTASISDNAAAISGLSDSIGGNSVQIAQNRDGIAMAMALAGSSWLQANENFALTLNVGHFDGSDAFAGTLTGRINDQTSLNGGVTLSASGEVGVRAGLRFGW